MQAYDGLQQLNVKLQEAAGLGFSAFPTLQQLAAASEDDLRADGFGYRWGFSNLTWLPCHI